MQILIVSSDYLSQPHNTIVDNIIKHLPEHLFKITNIPTNEEMAFANVADNNIIYFLNIMDMIKYTVPYNLKIPACVSIRSYRSIQEYPEKLAEILPKFKAISADNAHMIYSIEHPKKFETPHSADSDLFKETKAIDTTARKLTVGYVGSWRDDKQYKLFQKATEKLKGKLIIKLVGKVSKKIAFADMPDYYNDIDVLVCCSRQEGGPTPPLEAALCGRSTISTDVGFMKNAFGPNISLFDGRVENLVERLLFLVNHRTFCKEMGQKAKIHIQTHWNWNNLVENYRQMFEYTYERK